MQLEVESLWEKQQYNDGPTIANFQFQEIAVNIIIEMQNIVVTHTKLQYIKCFSILNTL